MTYYLYPPFFIVPEENNFADAWEAFCCKLLNLEEKTTEIYRRSPPEQGIDLYYPSKQIAYQCKSIESGKSGDFNVSKVIDSIRVAKNAQAELGWKKYVLCVNVDITGTAESKLKEELSGIEIKPKSHWVLLCEKFRDNVERHFRVLLTIPSPKVIDTVKQTFQSWYSEEMKAMIERGCFDIFLYSNRHDKVYRVAVSPEFKVGNLLSIIRRFFELPGSRKFNTEGITISLQHSIMFNGRTQVFTKSLEEIGVVAGSLITYWTTFVWSEEKVSMRGDVMHNLRAQMVMTPYGKGSTKVRVERAMKSFSENVKEAFDRFDASISESKD